MKTFSLKDYLAAYPIAIPYKVFSCSNTAGDKVIVTTPKGEVEIDEIEYKQGIFVTRTEKKKYKEISEKILDLETRSMFQLFNDWVKSLDNN